MIETAGLTFGYAPGHHVLAGFDHAFAPGSMTVVTGPSGRGKSTLLYVIAGLLRPTAGRVLDQGVDLTALTDGDCARWRADRVGFVFQDALLDPSRTVLENVDEGALYAQGRPRVSRARAGELLDRFGVEVDRSRRPGQISGGQAQRVALCRALVKDPPVLLADEPTGNLDAASAQVVWHALASAAVAGATVIVATHHLEQVRHQHEVIAL